MHTTRYERLTIHHNGDFSGAARILLLEENDQGRPELVEGFEEVPGKDLFRAVPNLARIEDWSNFVVESGDLTFRSKQDMVQIVYDGDVVEPTVEELRHIVAYIINDKAVLYVEDVLEDLDEALELVDVVPDEYFE